MASGLPSIIPPGNCGSTQFLAANNLSEIVPAPLPATVGHVSVAAPVTQAPRTIKQYEKDERHSTRAFWQIVKNEGMILLISIGVITTIAGVVTAGAGIALGIGVAILCLALLAKWYFHKQSQHWEDVAKSIAGLKQQADVFKANNLDFKTQNNELKLSNDEYQKLNRSNQGALEEQKRQLETLTQTVQTFNGDVETFKAQTQRFGELLSVEKEMLIREWEEVMEARALLIDAADEMDAAEDTFAKQGRLLTRMVKNCQDLTNLMTQLALPGHTEEELTHIKTAFLKATQDFSHLREMTASLESFMQTHQAMFDQASANTEIADASTAPRRTWVGQARKEQLDRIRKANIDATATFEEKRAALRNAIGMVPIPFPTVPNPETLHAPKPPVITHIRLPTLELPEATPTQNNLPVLTPPITESTPLLLNNNA